MIAFALPIQAEIGGLVFTTIRLFLLVVIIPLTFNLLSGRYGSVLVVDILFFLHMLWGTAALAVNNPDRVIAFMGSNSIEFIGGYVIARACIRNIEDFRRLCWLIICLILITLPLALYETLTGNPIIIRLIESMPGISSTTIANSAPRFGLERVQVFLPHPIHYGLFVSLILAIVFVGFKDRLSNMTRYTITFVVLACTMMSLSSGAVLAAFLQIGLIGWAWVFRKVGVRWIVFFGLCTVMYVVIDLLSNRTPIQVFLHYATFNSHNAYFRKIIFDWGIKNVWANPVFGIGLNDWERPVYMRSGSMDNFWLVMAVRYGLPGFLLLASGYLYGIWRVGRRNLNGDIPLLRLRQSWVIGMVGVTFSLTTVHVWGEIYSFIFFFFGAGMWMITATPSSGEANLASTSSKSYKRRREHYSRNKEDAMMTGPQIPYSRFPPHQTSNGT